MKTCVRMTAALGAVLLAGCVAYPGDGYGDTGYPTSGYPVGGYPSGGYPSGGYPSGYPNGGYPGNYPPPTGYPGSGGYPGTGYGPTIRCESTDNNTRHCDMDTRGGVYLSRRLSDAACIQGRNWGYDSRGVWVTGGCRAEFTAGRGGYAPPGNGSGYGPGYPGSGNGQVVRCESQDGHSRHCNVAVQRGVRLTRTLSDSACIEGSTWGWDRSGIWVDRGCRAEFSVF